MTIADLPIEELRQRLVQIAVQGQSAVAESERADRIAGAVAAYG